MTRGALDIHSPGAPLPAPEQASWLTSLVGYALGMEAMAGLILVVRAIFGG